MQTRVKETFGYVGYREVARCDGVLAQIAFDDEENTKESRDKKSERAGTLDPRSWDARRGR